MKKQFVVVTVRVTSFFLEYKKPNSCLFEDGSDLE